MPSDIIFGTLVTITAMVAVMAIHTSRARATGKSPAPVVRFGAAAIAFAILVGAVGIYLTSGR